MSNGNTVCECGARYSAFRSTDDAGNTLTFADVRSMMRVGSDDPELWVCRSRGAVLRFWSFLKRSQWDATHGYCAAVLSADATVDALPEWVTDSTAVDVGYAGDDEAVAEAPAVAAVVRVNAGTGHQIYHNSVNLYGALSGTATTSLMSSAFAISNNTQTGCDVRNNIFSNTKTGGTTSIAHVSVFLPSSLTNTMGLTWNNNVYFTGTTAGVHGIAHVGTTYTSPPSGPATYAGLYTAANFVPGSTSGTTNLRSYTSTLLVANTNNDNASLAYSTAAPFTTNTDLHIPAATSTQLESGGASVGVSLDIDMQVRPGPAGSMNGGASAPDIGADEFDGIPALPMTFVSSTTTQNNVTNVSTNSTNQEVIGIQIVTAGILAPLSATSFTFNTNGTTSTADIANAKCWYTGNSSTFATTTPVGSTIAAPSGSFTITGTQILGTGTNYFWLTYDVPCGVTPGNVIDAECNSLTVSSAQTPSVQAPVGSRTIIVGPISGTKTVGSGGTYATLTSAFSAINTAGLGGNTTLSILGNLSEPGAVVINPWLECGGSGFTLTIKPAPSTSPTISASATTAVFILNGADRVTIDGSNGSTVNTVCPPVSASRDLTITNTNTGTSSAVVWLQTATADGATNNTVKNCNIVGSGNTQTLFGIGSGSSSISTTSLGSGNNNNSYINNIISKTQYGIYSQGASTSSKNTGTIINQNRMNTVSPNNVAKGGIWTGFENNITISADTISEISQTSSPDVFGITLGAGATMSSTALGTNDVTNAAVTKNVIGNIINSGTFSAAGISVAAATSGTNLIANNMISGVTGNGTSGDFTAGIVLGGGTGSTTQVYYNTVSMQGTIPGSTAASQTSACLAVTTSTAPTLDSRDNIFTNTQLGNTGATLRMTDVALGYTSTLGNYAGLTSDHNDFYAAGAGPGTYVVGITGGVVSGTSRVTLADWTTETGRDGGGTTLNMLPVFVSPTNLHIDISNASNVPLDNAAVTIAAVTDDIDCQVRMTDMGADEFTISTCTVATGGTALVTGPSSFCSSGTPTITATGYSIGIGSGYQWMSSTLITDYPAGGTPVSMQTNPASLSTGVVTITTYYWLRVTCSTGMSTDNSNLLTITIITPPTATLSPFGSINICPPTTSQLLTSGTNASSPSYVWKKDGVVLGGEVLSTYSAVATGSYVVVVTDGSTMCSNTSSPAVITFNTQPAMPTVTPSSVTICSGDPAVLLTASGSGGGVGTANQSSGTISLAIPDNSSAGVNNTLTVSSVPAGSTIDSVIVTFNITHAFSADVEVNLEAPNGQIINLEADEGSTSALGFVNTRVSSDGTRPAFSTGSNPFTGTFKADANPQTNLIGSPAITTQTYSSLFSTINGGWKIRAYDDANLDVGTLVDWSIKISYHEPAATYVWTPNGGGFGLFTDAGATMVYTGTPTPTVYALPTSTTTYTATATNAGGCTNTNTVLVTLGTAPNAGTVNGTTPLCIGVTTTYTKTGDPGGTWTSTMPSVASVNPTTGLVTALTAGTTDITYTIAANSCGPLSASFQTLTVNPAVVMNTLDSGAGSLRDIIACVGDGATITFDPSIWNSTIVLTGPIVINKIITIAGPSGADVINISSTTPPVFNSTSGNLQFTGNVYLKL